MRDILFRGKDLTGVWHYGVPLVFDESLVFITSPFENNKAVVTKTVGQFTGITDKNGKKIFEGDIVRAQDDVFLSPFCDGIVGKIVYDECAFFIEPENPMDSQWLFNECAVYEVIGNIHDNPEPPKGEE